MPWWGGKGVANARFSLTLQLIIRLHLIAVTGAGRAGFTHGEVEVT